MTKRGNNVKGTRYNRAGWAALNTWRGTGKSQLGAIRLDTESKKVTSLDMVAVSKPRKYPKSEQWK